MQDLVELFESFNPSINKHKDKYGNYENTDVHNLFVGFKNWYNNILKKTIITGDINTVELQVLDGDTGKIVYLNEYRIYGLEPTGKEREVFFGVCKIKEVIRALQDRTIK